MTTFLQRDDFAVTARVLGALFYYSPESHETAPLVQALLTDDWQAQWPLDAEALAPVAAMFKTHSEESLPQAWQRLFIGPYALPSPPWGSVWLDRESVLFGDSTLALRQWMRENGIQFEMQQNEPEDHFGSLLLLAAWLAENDRHHECEQLLAWHLFPWSSLSGRIYRSCRASVLSGVGATGASDSGAMASSTHYSRRCKTVIPLIPTKGRILPAFSPIAAYFYLQKVTTSHYVSIFKIILYRECSREAA